MRTAVRVRIDANCTSGGKDWARPEAVPGQQGCGRTAIQSAKIGKEECGNGWKAGAKYDGRRIMESTTSQFKRLRGEALRAGKPECVMTERPPR